ncbi:MULTISPECIES: UPF0223 family protein [Bacillaceae]|uniref:UPF0223 family protein n=1 Tax=Evansella alkalicola TaxID=745819 RepID=A0ABS6JPT3_9BACI|nr:MULTISPECIES: UPF0223 family protein [Bacillaceae]MBU9720498.1 UPF0223 family protein [Bacillus alkalicola]
MKDDVIIPISIDWNKEEVVDVVNFYDSIDKAYRKGVEKEALLKLYRRFKEVVPGKDEEKQSFKEYEKQTNQSPYHVVKKAKESEEKMIIM